MATSRKINYGLWAQMPSLCSMALFLAFSLGIPSSALAQSSPQASTVQGVGLFMKSCFPFAGSPQALRVWILAHHLPPVPGDQAIFFADGRPSQVFEANTPDGPLALVSEEDGGCKVVIFQGDDDTAMQALVQSLEREHVSVAPGGVRMQPDGSGRQDSYLASLVRRHWELSITAQVHKDAPNLPPEITLLATNGIP